MGILILKELQTFERGETSKKYPNYVHLSISFSLCNSMKEVECAP